MNEKNCLQFTVVKKTKNYFITKLLSALCIISYTEDLSQKAIRTLGVLYFATTYLCEIEFWPIRLLKTNTETVLMRRT